MGLLSNLFPRRPQPSIDRLHPKIAELAKELRALHAMPIATKNEREAWSIAADGLRQRLYADYKEIYDSLPHELEHYLVDVDIRARDSSYAKYQADLLSDLLAPTNEGA